MIGYDADLREQMADSCRVITRHAEWIILAANAIETMPAYKTEAEDALNHASRVIDLACVAIANAKLRMGEKQLEPT